MATALLTSSTPKYLNEYDLIRSICKDDYFFFVQEFWDVVCPEIPIWNWHIPYLCNELQKIAEMVISNTPRTYDLVINVPPGTTKSTLCSVMFTPWVWTKMPHARFINATHAALLGEELSRKARDIILSEKYQKCFPEIKLRDDLNTKGYFGNTKGGDRLVATIGGKSPMGFHAHFLCVDDPIDPQAVLSEADLKTANTYMYETLPTRKVNKEVAQTVLIMQRLHQNDPTGNRLARQGGLPVKHICLPAELSNEIRPKGLKIEYENNLLDPLRLSKKTLETYKAEKGEYAYAGQFAQSPVPLGGGMFKVQRINLDKIPMKWKLQVRYWDKAGTLDAGCYTAGVKMGIDMEDRIWVCNVIRGQWDAHEREKVIKQTALLDTKNTRIGVEQEPGSGGKESAQYTARNLAGFRVLLDAPKGKKEARAEPFSDQVNAGNIWMPNTGWTQAYLDEMRFFPYSTYKDQIDASSGAFAMLTKPRIVIGAVR